MGRCKNKDIERLWWKGWQVLVKVLAILCIAIFLTGCRSVRYVPVENMVYRNVVRHDTLHTTDSVLVHDSVACIQKGDTVFRDRWHSKLVLRNVYRTKTDSIVKRDSIRVPYPIEKELSKWEKFHLKYATWSMGAVCMLLVTLGIIVYRKNQEPCKK